MLGEVQPLACIHPAQGGVACRDPSTPCGLRRGKRIGRGYPHGLRRGLEKVNAAKAAQSKRAILRDAYIPAHKACQILSRHAATTFSSPGRKPGGCPPSHLQLTQPRPRAGWIHANACLPTTPVRTRPRTPPAPSLACRAVPAARAAGLALPSICRRLWVSCLVFPLLLFVFSIHYHKFLHLSSVNFQKMLGMVIFGGI